NHALWDCYRDLGSLRAFEIACIALLSVAAVVPAFRLGARFGGLAGAILCGGLFAAMPLFVDLACQTRSYSMAWSFGAFALDAAVRGAPRGRWWTAAVFLGLS